MTPTEIKYVDKLKELRFNYLLFRRVSDNGIKNTCVVKMDKLESEISALEQEMEKEKNKNLKDIIEDGFGSVWSAWCPMCKKKSMQVVRPGKAQCKYCG